MNNLYEVLEICLQDLEQGTDLETILYRYPDLADELRPILETSVHARGMAVAEPSADVVRRNRAKVLQQASQIREAKIYTSQRIWFASLRRLAVTLVVLAVLFASGTGLVRAASTTLPGDNLYPVKRTWEDVLLTFTFNAQQRSALEVEHENERIQELHELFAKGQAAKVEFVGSVTRQNGNQWLISNIPVTVSAQTEIRDQGQGILIGQAVSVRGQTQGNNVVLAEKIELLPANAILPDAGDEPEIETEQHNGSIQQNNESSGKDSENETPVAEETKSSESGSAQQDESFTGTVDSINNSTWDVNGVSTDVSSAEINGTPNVGATVKVEGYYDANGVFIAKKVEFDNSSSGNDTGSGSSDSSNGGTNQDSSHDNTDTSGGGSNSGSDGSGGGGHD